jgi:putative phage-type endonuclease
MDRAVFLEARRRGIGGSDVAKIVGEAQSGCALAVWNDKRGLSPEEAPTKAMQRGTRLEDFVAKEWAADRGANITRWHLTANPKTPYFIANIDRQILSDPRGRGVLEIKVPGKYNWLKMRREGLPADYILQMQWYLYVTGWAFGSYAIFNADSFEFADEGKNRFDVLPNPAIIAAILPRLHDFWRMVEYGPAPDKLDRDDPRCTRCKYRPTCHEEEADATPEGGAEWSTDAVLIQHIRAYREFSEIEKAAAEEKKAAVEAAAALVKGKTSTPAGSITYVPGSPRFSMPLLEKQDKDLEAKLRREYSAASAPYWRITPKKEE